MDEIKIGSYIVGLEHPPFLIAEMSGNHNCSLERALKIVEAAKYAGAHAIKLQTYTADTMTLDIHKGEFLISNPNSLWYGETLYNLYKQAHTPREWHPPIFERCRELDLVCFSTPFDHTSVDFLETLHVPCYKIASLEITDIPLIQKAASTKKPLLLSTGGSTLEEIEEAVTAAKEAGCTDLILLKCTSAYPASPQSAHLRTLPHLATHFKTVVGLSDHTLGIGTAIASVVLGARVIEKHFTLSRADGGVDSAFSLEPNEFKELSIECRRAWESLGQVHYGAVAEEATSLSHRRSLYFVKDVNKGEVISEENIRAIRPGKGLPPKEYAEILGKKIVQSVKKGDPVTWEVMEPKVMKPEGMKPEGREPNEY